MTKKHYNIVTTVKSDASDHCTVKAIVIDGLTSLAVMDSVYTESDSAPSDALIHALAGIFPSLEMGAFVNVFVEDIPGVEAALINHSKNESDSYWKLLASQRLSLSYHDIASIDDFHKDVLPII